MLTRRRVSELLESAGLAPSRALGQNFVVDPNTVRKIAHLAGVGQGDHVVEIGAGLGSLTLALAETGASVTAIELDRHLVPLLRLVVEPAGAQVIHADAREVDWAGLPVDTVVGNLPYNIATDLVLHVLEHAPQASRLLVMVQREVGERLAAGPGTKTYGIPSVKVAYWATARLVGRVPPSVFLPQPRVESVLVALVRHPSPPVTADRRRLFALVDAGFGQRRKMLRRSLSGLVSEEQLVAAGVSPQARAEQLSLQDWEKLVTVRK